MKNKTANLLAKIGEIMVIIGAIIMAIGIAMIDGDAFKLTIITLMSGIIFLGLGVFINEVGCLNMKGDEKK